MTPAPQPTHPMPRKKNQGKKKTPVKKAPAAKKPAARTRATKQQSNRPGPVPRTRLVAKATHRPREAARPISELALEVRPSPDSNDHEVLVLVDGRVLWGGANMGLDPPTLFEQLSNPRDSLVLIGRCKCGVVGCDDVYARVEHDPDVVRWRVDHSWEDTKRRAERLVADVLRGCSTHDGYDIAVRSSRYSMNTPRPSAQV